MSFYHPGHEVVRAGIARIIPRNATHNLKRVIASRNATRKP